jgi:hypothetical protein
MLSGYGGQGGNGDNQVGYQVANRDNIFSGVRG